MKTQFNTYTDVRAVDALRERARELNVPIGALMSLCVRYALQTIPAGKLEGWAKSAGTGTQSGALKKDDRACLRAIEALNVDPRQEGATKHEAKDVARQAGLTRALAIVALERLRARGLVDRWVINPEADRWGFYLNSFWFIPKPGSAKT